MIRLWGLVNFRFCIHRNENVINNLLSLLIIFNMALFLSGCTSHKLTYAPVTDASIIEPIPKKGIRIVQKGDSFYSIAWRYGLDSHDLARRNHLTRPYHIHVGQVVYLKGHAPIILNKPVMQLPITKSIKVTQKSFIPKLKKMEPEPKLLSEPSGNIKHWIKPSRGPIVASFSNSNKGINISGHLGDPIFASAKGKVVYSGDGLRGYGNLIIIEHNQIYMTAYAHNQSLLVKEGDWVKAGQVIAKMGNSGTHKVMLHFEIRKNGKPINPMIYLKN